MSSTGSVVRLHEWLVLVTDAEGNQEYHTFWRTATSDVLPGVSRPEDFGTGTQPVSVRYIRLLREVTL